MRKNSHGNPVPGRPDQSQPSARRGFAAMEPERQRQIASQGGKAAHASGNAHEFNTAEAREAGRKGGLAGRRTSNPKPQS